MTSVVKPTRAMDAHKGYEEAVKTLNTLQSNAQTIEKMRQERDKKSHLNIPYMIRYVQRTGITLEDIDRMNVIHVSGTKGKGSTCAFCESILRHHGYKTGFFSSPHLVEVRERFRINGQPLSRGKFADYFWEVYNKLISSQEVEEMGMPAYFAFLTVMAFNVFMQEKVDVAIIEVGIGGQYDSTNLVRKPVVCGVSSLGLDHVSILGDTIEKIAWHKAGIFKPGVPAVTSPQPDAAMKVLQQRAAEIGSPLRVASALESFEREEEKLQLGICGQVQRLNASLAIELCKIFLKKRAKEGDGKESKISSDKEMISSPVKQGLEHCRWAGRTQMLKRPGLTYFLDGAHTVESIQQCVEWFKEASERDAKGHKGRVAKVVVFNSTGDRDPSLLIEPLMECDFDAAVFCPNLAYAGTTTADMTNLTVTKESQMNRVLLNMHAWERVMAKKKHYISPSSAKHKAQQTSKIGRETLDDSPKPKLPRMEQTETIATTDQSTERFQSSKEVGGSNQSEILCDNDFGTITREFNSIYTALQWATQGRELSMDTEIDLDEEIPDSLKDVDHIQVLVTGSLHLVGGVLGVVGISSD